MLGLTAAQFEKPSAKRAAFDTAEAAKPAPPPKRKRVTPAEFEKIKADAVANGFMDLHVIGKAWGMKWAKTLEYMHFLDPSTKDTVQLILGSHRKNGHSAVGKARTLQRRVRPAHGHWQAASKPTSEADRNAGRDRVESRRRG